MKYLSRSDDCSTPYPPSGDLGPIWASTESTDTTVDGLIPATQDAPVQCVLITITDGGLYDADVTMDASEGVVGTISDPIVGVMNSPDIKLAHGSSGGGGGGGNGFLGIGSAGAWMIMALLTVLGLSMLRRRRVTVRSEL